MSNNFVYFAFGSNMLTRRLISRCPSATKLSNSLLRGYRLYFDKRSWKDGSGKCRIAKTESPDDSVWGVLYLCSAKDKENLNRVEGVGQGYEASEIEVENQEGNQTTALFYEASLGAIELGLEPFTWYRSLVLAGAVQNELPKEYIEQIAAVAAVEDIDRIRHAYEIELCEQIGP
jgi:gamma-glutamylcyclotransferase